MVKNTLVYTLRQVINQSIWGGVAKKDSACGRVKKGDILKAGYGAYTMVVGAGRRGNVGLEGYFQFLGLAVNPKKEEYGLSDAQIEYREVNMWLYVIGLFTLCLGIGIESLSISFLVSFFGLMVMIGGVVYMVITKSEFID